MSGTCDVEGVVMCGTCDVRDLRCVGVVMSGTCDVEGVVMCGTCHVWELRCQGIGISATFVHSSTHDFLLCARVIFVCAHV